MTSFQLKLIAIITMVIDHIGLFFFPNILVFRVIGRLAFPLFAWFIASGARYTHNINRYLARLLVLALISQIPFLLANRHIDPSFWWLNVVFTLFFGLLAIALMQKTKDKRLWLLIAVLCAAIAQVLKTDYGALGVVSIILFFLFSKNMKYLVLSQLALFFFPIIYVLSSLQKTIPTITAIEPFGLLSLVFIALYNGKEGTKAKYLFYIFYPLQYVLIYIFQLLIL